MFVFVKSIKEAIKWVSFMINMLFKPSERLLFFLEFKKHLVVGPDKKKETHFVKIIQILHLMTFDPILK